METTIYYVVDDDDNSSYCGSDCTCGCHHADDDYDTSFYDQVPNTFNVMMLTPHFIITSDLEESEEYEDPTTHIDNTEPSEDPQ
jgi:hypothetical protein